MKMTFRWFGEKDDSVKLWQIKQIPGMTGVVGALLIFLWRGLVFRKINQLKTTVNNAGLELEVIESVNVHEDIKLGLPTRDMYIENYIKTIKI